ncbi:MAG: ABC-type uncharacterized transport system auxiliary subunit, partial [Maribacter sp.]
MNRLRHSLLLSVLMLLIFACSEKQDFSQYNDLSITPSLETSIFFVKVQELLINSATDISFFTQDFNFDA